MILVVWFFTHDENEEHVTINSRSNKGTGKNWFAITRVVLNNSISTGKDNLGHNELFFITKNSL